MSVFKLVSSQATTGKKTEEKIAKAGTKQAALDKAKLDADKKHEADERKLLQSRIASCKVSAPGSDGRVAWDMYEASPKFSKEREKILALFKGNKSRKWTTNITREHFHDVSTTQSALAGVCAKCPCYV